MRTNKLRTLLTGFSVSWGIFILILLLSIANGMVRMWEESTQTNDPMRISIYSGYTTMPFMGLKPGRYLEMNQRYFDDIEDSNQHNIKNVTGYRWIQGQISSQLDYLSDGYAQGVYPEYFTGRYTLIHGRFLNDADLDQKRKVIVLPKSAAATLFGAEEKAVGNTVTVNGYTFTVVGVYDHRWEDTPLVPFTTADALTGFSGYVNATDVHLQDINSTEQSNEVVAGVRATLAKDLKFDPSDPGGVYTYNRYEQQENNATANRILTYVMWVIGILTLLTGIVGVSNIMFVSVRERTHEIGIRRAIGAKPRAILMQVVIESVALTTVFGYIGIVMGTLATELARHMMSGSELNINPTADLAIALEVTATLIVTGAMAGIFPALRAIKVKPVEALSEE